LAETLREQKKKNRACVCVLFMPEALGVEIAQAVCNMQAKADELLALQKAVQRHLTVALDGRYHFYVFAKASCRARCCFADVCFISLQIQQKCNKFTRPSTFSVNACAHTAHSCKRVAT
jgi:hypothetical protein